MLPLVFAGVFVLILVIWFQVDNSDSVETLQQPQAAVQETGESEDTVHKEKQGQEDETDLAGTAQARQLLADMSLEDKVAQLFVITPEALTGIEDVTAAGSPHPRPTMPARWAGLSIFRITWSQRTSLEPCSLT